MVLELRLSKGCSPILRLSMGCGPVAKAEYGVWFYN